jgi:BirA family biotin operon repressor/biotin-[acetyl-CoA-carboxylase] ligase
MSALILPAHVREQMFTSVIGQRLYYYPETPSTNDVALELARAGEPDGTVVYTDSQTSGRGRGANTWISPPRRDLALSLILRPEGPVRSVLPITMVISIAISVVLTKLLDVDVGVKWPNDVVSGGRKLAGILAEGVSRGGESTFVVVGIGINVNSVAEDFPVEIRDTVTSCAQTTSQEFDRAGMMADILGTIESYYQRFRVDGFGPLIATYEDRHVLADQSISIRDDNSEYGGVVLGVQEDGALMIRSDTGHEIRLYNETVRLHP